MPTITIQQTGTETASPFSACVIFDHGESVPVTITDPFSVEEEARLEWYFEEWLVFPFTDTVKAEAAAHSVKTYGEVLFDQVFGDRRAYARYTSARNAGLDRPMLRHHHFYFCIGYHHDCAG
jgi:hypothetical protein